MPVERVLGGGYACGDPRRFGDFAPFSRRSFQWIKYGNVGIGVVLWQPIHKALGKRLEISRLRIELNVRLPLQASPEIKAHGLPP